MLSFTASNTHQYTQYTTMYTLINAQVASNKLLLNKKTVNV